MLRSVRFMAKLDMFLEKPSEQPIRELAPLLKNIPPARLFDESLKLLQSGNGVKLINYFANMAYLNSFSQA